MGLYSDRDQWHVAAGHLDDPVVLLQIQVRTVGTIYCLSSFLSALRKEN